MAGRKRRNSPTRGPANAERWRAHARYLAESACIPDARHCSIRQLREAAEMLLGALPRDTPARMIVGALDAADEGRPYKPYSDREARCP